MSDRNKNFWIIGASSGIGAALARRLSSDNIRLALSARRADVLHDLAKSLGSNHLAVPFDVTDTHETVRAAQQIKETLGHIDAIIVLSAVYTPSPVAKIDMPTAANIINTNLIGALNCVHAAIPILRAQGGGILALCGSVAGYRGLPNAQPYGATKAAIINLAETLRIEEEGHGIDVRLINPGFVRTPMTDKNSFDMPMIITPDEAAQSIMEQLSGRSFEIHFPKKFTLLMRILRLLPDSLYFTLMRRFR